MQLYNVALRRKVPSLPMMEPQQLSLCVEAEHPAAAQRIALADIQKHGDTGWIAVGVFAFNPQEK